MYLEHWGLQEKPFENNPDPRFLYPSAMHTEGLNRLLYAVREHKGLALLTGDYGSGKTILMRSVVETLDPTQYDVGLINYPIFAPREFLQEILAQFGKEAKTNGTRLELFQQVCNFAYENLKAGKHNLLVIDEAQLIEDSQVFEEVRLLLNMQLSDTFLTGILLVGQSELRERLMEYPQLEQRISVKCHLHQFDQEDTKQYIRHRLKIAGLRREIFAPNAYHLIYRTSRGVARRINNMCDLSLLEGATSEAKMISEKIVQRVL